MVEKTSAYAVVIADLKKQRAELDQMIEKLETLARGKNAPATSAPSSKPHETNDEKKAPQNDEGEAEVEAESDNPFLGMKIRDAVKIVLAKRRRPMAPADIHSELERGGLMISNPNTVASVLSRRQRDVGDVVSPRRGVWGLKEWYPGRSFGKKNPAEDRQTAATDDANVTTEHEQHDEQPRIFPLRSNS